MAASGSIPVGHCQRNFTEFEQIGGRVYDNGVLAPILMNALRSWRESTLDREKSERYRTAWVELKRLSAEADAARRALEAGDPALARDLVGRVHAVMSAESEAWTPTTNKA